MGLQELQLGKPPCQGANADIKVTLFIILAPIIGGVIAFVIALITVSRSFGKKMVSILILSTLTYFIMHYMVEYLDVKPVMMWIVMGMIIIFILTYTWYQLVHGKRQTALKESNMYKKLQLLSSAAFSLGHGGADSQKVMGIICAALMVFANSQRNDQGQITGNIPKMFQISEVFQIEFNDKYGRKEKFKPEYTKNIDSLKIEKEDHILIYTKGDDIYDAKTHDLIFKGKTLNKEYMEASIFSKYVDQEGEIRKGHKIKAKVNSETMPGWIAFSCYLMIGLGTMMGGW